jgi:hypothetical protein
MRQLLLVALMLVPGGSWAANDPRVTFLEQEVRNLQRQVLALSRQVEELRTRPERPKARPLAAPEVPSASDPARWADASHWRQLRKGMSELEVINLLGPPTSMREENGARLLLYAMDIGGSGFLGGSVTLRERQVIEVREPALQ